MIRRGDIWVPRSTCDVVEVTPFNLLGGGTPQVTHFEDTFNRASGPLGQNWVQTVGPFIPVVDPITTATFSIGAAVDLAQAMIVTKLGTGNPNTTFGVGLLCMPIYMSNYGKSQFSEWLIVANDRVGANDSFGGPAVFFQNSGGNSIGNEQLGLFGYTTLLFASNKAYQVNRGNSQTATAMFSGGAASWANGDILRLEIIATPSQNTITLKKNGAVLNSTVDNSVGRLTTGSPGWFGQGLDNSGGGSMTSQWRNFKGGLL